MPGVTPLLFFDPVPFASYMSMAAHIDTYRINKKKLRSEGRLKRPSEGHQSQEKNSARSSRGTISTVFEVGTTVSRGRESA